VVRQRKVSFEPNLAAKLQASLKCPRIGSLPQTSPDKASQGSLPNPSAAGRSSFAFVEHGQVGRDYGSKQGAW